MSTVVEYRNTNLMIDWLIDWLAKLGQAARGKWNEIWQCPRLDLNNTTYLYIILACHNHISAVAITWFFVLRTRQAVDYDYAHVCNILFWPCGASLVPIKATSKPLW